MTKVKMSRRTVLRLSYLLVLGVQAPLPVLAANSLTFAANDLDGKRITFPESVASAQRVAVVVGASQKAGDAARTWSKRLATLRGRGTQVFSLILLDRVPGFVRRYVASSIRKDLERADDAKMVFIGSDGSVVRTLAPSGSDDVPVVFVTTASGLVLDSVRANPDPDALARIEHAIDTR